MTDLMTDFAGNILFCNFYSFYFPRLFEEPETRAQSMLIKVSPLNRQKNSPGGHTYLSAVSSICQWYNCSHTLELNYLLEIQTYKNNNKENLNSGFVSTSKEWNWLWSELGSDSGEQELTVETPPVLQSDKWLLDQSIDRKLSSSGTQLFSSFISERELFETCRHL